MKLTSRAILAYNFVLLLLTLLLTIIGNKEFLGVRVGAGFLLYLISVVFLCIERFQHEINLQEVLKIEQTLERVMVSKITNSLHFVQLLFTTLIGSIGFYNCTGLLKIKEEMDYFYFFLLFLLGSFLLTIVIYGIYNAYVNYIKKVLLEREKH